MFNTSLHYFCHFTKQQTEARKIGELKHTETDIGEVSLIFIVKDNVKNYSFLLERIRYVKCLLVVSTHFC